MRALGCALLAALVLAGSAAAAVEVTFRTSDGWRIHADYQRAAGAREAVILLHQRGGSAADWVPLVARLTAAGIASLAVDQRGAGRSLGPRNGAAAPWNTTKDIAAAVEWLRGKGFAPGRIALAGASYGANNALLYAAAHPQTPAVALLSPGSDYNGLRAGPAAARYRGRILVLASSADPVTGGGPELIARVHRGPLQRVTYAGDAHGTALLSAHPGSLGTLVSFLRRAGAGG